MLNTLFLKNTKKKRFCCLNLKAVFKNNHKKYGKQNLIIFILKIHFQNFVFQLIFNF